MQKNINKKLITVDLKDEIKVKGTINNANPAIIWRSDLPNSSDRISVTAVMTAIIPPRRIFFIKSLQVTLSFSFQTLHLK